MAQTKKLFIHSLLIFTLCVSMFTGTTFAWFTDSVSATGNIITSGNLDLEMYWTDKLNGDETVWYDVEADGAEPIFNYDNWEPGYTEVRYIKLVNAGSLAMNYQLTLKPTGSVGKLAEVINVYAANEGVVLENRDDVSEKLGALGLLSSVMNGGAAASGTLLAADEYSPLHNSGEVIVTLAMNMITTAGNEYQNTSIGDGFTITALATQCAYEADSFGSDYDSGAEFPGVLVPSKASASVTPVNGKIPAGGVTLTNGTVSAYVPEGVLLNDDTDTLTLTITPLENTTSDITTVNQEILIPVDVHIEGVSDQNDVPISINLGEILPKYLNMGNYHLYHVEDGANKVMTLVDSNADFTEHNQFKYDLNTGAVSVAMATFSEVALVADTENAWEGEFDYTWYDASKTELTIANADQLAAFGAIVGGMNGQTKANFSGKTVKLISNINLGDKDGSSDEIFYPIGYYNSTGSYKKVSGGSITSSVSSFEGTFDGNGHTISNFYQNTWEMFGDYNDGYGGTPNHYKDAMGLFGYVNGGTVKNLTISDFSSDGEFTPTGVIAAYAANSTFENIAITNCNPRVYNTGNGGIVGIGGNSNDPDTYKLTFTNITIDNSNIISALWGSWDVACGGLVGMFRGAGHVYMTNCHVAAQMDVYNDVCGNYQYYWYRYSGMMVGTNKNMITDKDGYTVPETSKFHAEGCTVHFGNWNDYYYCELVANSLASYTHDHQFSRLTQIKSLDEIKTGDTWTKTGNFLLISGDNKTCYHIIKDSDGTLKQHLHADAGTETVNGETVLKEDNQVVYLPFNQLFTGYGWGVKHIPVYNGEDYAFEGITILDREVADSVKKFEIADTAKDSYSAAKTISIGELFDIAEIEDEKLKIKSESVQVTVSPAEEGSTAGGTYVGNADDWKQGKLTLSGEGKAYVTITDYYFCTPTTINITVTALEEVFDVVFKNADKYIYRVGNMNEIALGSLFTSAVASESIGNIDVTIEGCGYKVSKKSDWSKSTIKFNENYTGLVTVTISDDINNIPTELNLEVVDAVNATSAVSAKANNVVLLNDCNLTTIEVSGGYTLYGNGFKMTATTDPMYDTMNAGFVVLKNGTLDNVQVICPNFSYAIIYNSQIKDKANTAKPSDTGNDARGNVRSAVMADGNSKIVNSYVHGGRAAVFLRSGNLLVDGSTISGGAAANIHALSAQSLTLRNTTLIQKPLEDNVHNTGKTLMGFSGLFECGEDGYSTPLILEGTLIQDAWINEGYKGYAPSAASSIVDAALKKTDYLHDLDGDGKKESLNLGFTYIPQNAGGDTNANVTDNRTNRESVPYAAVDVGNSIASAKVYSYKNTNGTLDEFSNSGDYVPSNQGSTAPTVSFEDINTDRVFKTEFDVNDNRWESTLEVNLDNGNYTFSFNNLFVQKNGVNLDYTVKTADGTKVDRLEPVALTTSCVTDYVLTVTDGNTTHALYFTLIASKKTVPGPEAVDTTGGTPLLVVKSKNSDWSCALPALEGIEVKYYESADKSVTLDLATLTPATTGKQNGTNNYWEISKDGYKLKVTCGVIHDTKQVYGMPVVVDNNGTKQMYFTISSTNGYVSTGTAARSVTLTYEFTDPNGKDLTFTKNWNVKYAEYKDKAQYSYSEFVKGTMKDLLSSSDGSDGGCVTPDTLITLADGSQVRVDSLTGEEKLLVWNMETGALDSADIMFNDSEAEAEVEVIQLTFSDGKTVDVITEHGFWDFNLSRYVYLDRTAEAYIGHWFAKQDGEKLAKVQLTDVELRTEMNTAWSPVTEEHLCYFVNGMLCMPGGVGGLFNIFDVDSETMTYDFEAMAKDIETYGLFTYEELSQYAELSEDMFYNAGGPYLKVSMAKGNLTEDELIAMIQRYSKYFE